MSPPSRMKPSGLVAVLAPGWIVSLLDLLIVRLIGNEVTSNRDSKPVESGSTWSIGSFNSSYLCGG